MKKIIIGLLAAGSITFVACNSRSDKKTADHDSSKMNNMKQNESIDTTKVAEITPTFSNVDSKTAASLKIIVDHYLHIKNALANDDGRETAKAGKAMAESFAGVDKSLLTAEQKKVYDDIEDDLKEHAEHIGKNGADIEHQREHFSMMSEDVYDLVKAFGGGRTLYHDFCPMYNEGKGAMWLSEITEIKNPYFGSKMPACGSIEEKIK